MSNPLLEPHHLPPYAMELAAVFNAFYRDCRVVSSDPADEAISRARLKLAGAAYLIYLGFRIWRGNGERGAKDEQGTAPRKRTHTHSMSIAPGRDSP